MIRAGKLDQRVSIERLARVSDGMGGYSETWTSLGEVWAQVVPVRGAEKWEAMRVSPDARMKVRVRWRGDSGGQPFYTTADRLTWRGRVYSIESVAPYGGRQEMIEIGISEGVA